MRRRKSFEMVVSFSLGSGVKLKNTEEFLRKSDPFFELSRLVDAAGAQTCDDGVKSYVVNDNLSPNGKEIATEWSIFYGGDQDSQSMSMSLILSRMRDTI